MIEIETVLILGAGASIPYGLPSGRKLISKIYDEIYNNDMARYPFLRTSFDNTDVKKFARQLIDSGTESIDAFLEHQKKEWVKIGKAAIASELLQCESCDRLVDYWLDIDRCIARRKQDRNTDSWYHCLWSELSAPFEHFPENKLKIITFNYDRSLEWFLFTTLKNLYPGRSDADYAKQLSSIPIIHVHGKMGLLPYEIPDKDKQNAVPHDMNSTTAEKHIISGNRSASINHWVSTAAEVLSAAGAVRA